jgi:hypothetical protein
MSLSLTGKYDIIAIRRWRAMTVRGLFGMNAEIEAIFHMQLNAAVTILERTLETAFPEEGFCLISSEGARQLEEIVRTARSLSSRLQTGVFFSQLVVTIVPVNDGSNGFFGTHALGVDRISGTERITLLKAKPITNIELLPFFA